MAKSKKIGSKGSTSWEEHGGRVRAEVAIGTSLFMRANEERIAKASSAAAAKNSYASGMIDMLSVARSTFGFWGAEQILMELERLNRKHAPPKADADGPDASPIERSQSAEYGASRASGKEVPPTAVARQKAAKSVDKDPMFG